MHIMKFLIMHFLTFFGTFLRTKYSLHSVLKHRHSLSDLLRRGDKFHIHTKQLVKLRLYTMFIAQAYRTPQYVVPRGGIFSLFYTACLSCRLIRLLSTWCHAAEFFSASGAALSQEVPTVKWMSNQPALWTTDIFRSLCFNMGEGKTEHSKLNCKKPFPEFKMAWISLWI
jgi:hypothetical protein